MRKSRRYAGWHETPLHEVVHSFVLALLFLSSALTGLVGWSVFSPDPLDVGPAATILSGSTKDDVSSNDAVPAPQEMHRQNLNLLSALEHYEASSASEKSQGLKGLLVAAEARKNAMLKLMKEDPQQAFILRMPQDLADKLPAEVQGYVERQKEVRGKWSTIHLDYLDADQKGFERGEFVYTIEADATTYDVHFAEQEPEILSGAEVIATGITLGDEMVIAAGTEEAGFKVASTGVASAGEENENVLGATLRRTLVLAFTFENSSNSNPSPIANLSKYTFMDSRSANHFYEENSAGLVGLAGEVYGWFQIPASTNGVCNYPDWVAKARTVASTRGYNLSNYDNFIYIFSGTNTGCPWAGMGLLGGTPTWSMLNGQFNMDSSINFEGIANHELGHNFGVRHASSVTCGTSQIDAASNCTFEEYGDPSDVMGAWTYSTILNKYVALQFNGPHKIQEGWGVTSSQVQTVTTNGTYTITPLEVNDGGLKALKIAKPTGIGPGATPYYFITYRQPLGFDASFKDAASGSLLPAIQGASIHAWSMGNTYLIDVNANSSGKNDSFLYDGGTFVDPLTGLTVTQLSHDKNGVTVSVKFGPVSGCVRSAPGILTTGLPYLSDSKPGLSMSYSVKVTNNNLNCGSSTYDFSASLPSGWILKSITPTNATLAQGGSQTVTYVVQAPTTLPLGSSELNFFAKDRSDPSYIGNSKGYFTYYSTTTDVIPPFIEFAEPGGGTVKGTLFVTIVASDETKLKYVQLYRNGTLARTWTASPFRESWNTSTYPNGTYSMYAKAYDAAGNVATSETVTVTVNNSTIADTQAPTVPQNVIATAISSSQVNLFWSASTDNTGVTGYKIYRNGTQITTTTGTSYSSTGLVAGTAYTYTVSAYDAAGNNSAQSSSAQATTIAASADTIAPSGNISSPVSGATLTGTANVAVSASDNVGVTKVELYKDSGTLIGTDTLSPYSFSWNTASEVSGTHTLYAKVYDANNNIGTSPSVNVTVNNVPDTTPPVVSIVSPASGTTVKKGSLKVQTMATDDKGISKIEIRLGTGSVTTCTNVTTCTASFAVSKIPNGVSTITATAYDTATPANMTSTSVEITK